MRRSTFNYIKDILRDYAEIDRYIEQRKEELRFPYRDDDINSGIKGNKIKDSMTEMMVTIEQDKRLTILERNRQVVRYHLNYCDKDTYTIINELYIKKRQEYTIEGLIQQKIIFCSRRKAFSLRDKFFENVALDLGIDI
ncbi:transcriptional regulator [Globicatella sulfidifaciens]